MAAGIQYGLILVPYVNQFHPIGGIQAGIKFKHLDHLEIMNTEDIEALKKHGYKMPVVSTFMPYFFKYSHTGTRNDKSWFYP